MTDPCSHVCINSYTYACMYLLAVMYTVVSRFLVPIALAQCTTNDAAACYMMPLWWFAIVD